MAERGYPDERWYADDRGGRDGYAEPEWGDRRGSHGVPEQRYSDEPPRRSGSDARYASLAELSGEMERRRGMERPALEQREQHREPREQPREHWEPPREEVREAPRAEPVERERGALRRAAEGPTRQVAEPVADGVYRSKRPALAVGIGIGIGILELAMFRVFAAGIFGDPLDAGRAVSGGLLLVALPLFGLGLYALATGAARAVDMWGPRVWLRPPLAYLTVSLVLMIAAGAAA